MERTASSPSLSLASLGDRPSGPPTPTPTTPAIQPSSRLVGGVRLAAFALVVLYALFSSLLLWLAFSPRSSLCHVFSTVAGVAADVTSTGGAASSTQAGVVNVGLGNQMMVTTTQTVSMMPVEVKTNSGQQEQQPQPHRQDQRGVARSSSGQQDLSDGALRMVVPQDERAPLLASSARPPPPKFFLYRLLGNSLPPLQCDFQMYRNTLFALKHEPPLADCRRLWVLNHNINATERGMLIDLLLAHGYTMEVGRVEGGTAHGG